jgi:hypothetical protein
MKFTRLELSEVYFSGCITIVQVAFTARRSHKVPVYPAKKIDSTKKYSVRKNVHGTGHKIHSLSL